ncbi:MAG: MBL fold metallo-hydrolase [Actinomycetia bacterium]|nr:MBL fold metallo-hydrolase [Actinomycetes bacterium]
MKINRIRFSMIGAALCSLVIVITLLSFVLTALISEPHAQFIFFFPGGAGGGDGSAGAVISPDGKIALINAGPCKYFDRSSKIDIVKVMFSSTIRDSVLKLGYINIDYLILTTLDTGRIGGTKPLLDKLKIKEILSPYKISWAVKKDGILSKKEFFKIVNDYKLETRNTENELIYLNFKWFVELAHEKGVKFTRISEGKLIKLGKDVKLEIMHPQAKKGSLRGYKSNEIVIKAVHGENSVLYTGGIDGYGMQDLFKRRKDDLKVDIFEIPNYGEKFGSDYKFIKTINPDVAVLNYYWAKGRKLDPEVMARYENRGIRVYNVDDSGALVIRSYKDRYEIEELSPKSEIRLHSNKKGIPKGIINKKNKHLEVTFVDVGQADCTFVRTPNGKVMLIDGGDWGDEKFSPSTGEHVVVPFLKKNNVEMIDYLIVTHPHADHVGGIPAVIDKFKVGKIIDCGVEASIDAYRYYISGKNRKNITFIKARPGSKIKLDEDVSIRILAPLRFYEPSRRGGSDLNNDSVVISLKYGEVSYLLTGDIEEEAERDIMNKYPPEELKATVMHVPHHGGKSSSTMKFLETVDPQFSVISVSKWNKYGHPKEEALNRYRIINSALYRTDFDGDVYTYTDGSKIEIETEK